MPDHAHARSPLRRLVAAAAAAAAALAVTAAPALAAPTAPTAPPPVTILSSSGHSSRDDLFITPTGDTTQYANGPEILDRRGNVVWFHPIPAGLTAADFRVQHYRGRSVLTWWQGTGLGGWLGTDYIYNDHYQPIATVNAGNGLSADGHEFLITPQNTALVLAYTTATADLTSIGGPANQTVIDGVVQEIDIRPAWSCSSGTALTTCPTARASSRCRLPEHALGLVSHQRRPPRCRRQPPHRRT